MSTIADTRTRLLEDLFSYPPAHRRSVLKGNVPEWGMTLIIFESTNTRYSTGTLKEPLEELSIGTPNYDSKEPDGA